MRLILLVLAVSVLPGCVSLNTHGALREAYNKTEAEKEAAKKQAAQASTELVRLQQEVASLRSSNEALAGQVKDLQATLQELKRTQAEAGERSAKTVPPVPTEPARIVQPIEPSAAVRPSEPVKAPSVSAAARKKISRSLETALKDEIARGRGFLHEEPHLTLGLSEDVLFINSSSAAIKPDGLTVLKRIADALREGGAKESKEIRVEAYADVPKPAAQSPSNADLSVARANSLVRYFKSQDLVGPGQLLAIGNTEAHNGRFKEPVPTKTRFARVEIIVTFK